MLKCPYCFEVLPKVTPQCPHCSQFIIDDPIEADFPSLDKKKCIFCGNKVLAEAKFCRYCRRWLDEIDRAADEIDPKDLV